MKVGVVGSRTYKNYEEMKKVLDDFNSEFPIEEIFSGGAKGADSLAEKYARERFIPTTIFFPQWEKYGKAAGPIRNRKIVEASECIFAFWDGKSRGTKNTIEICRDLKKPVNLTLFKE